MNKLLIAIIVFGMLLFGCTEGPSPVEEEEEPEKEETEVPETVPDPSFTITSPNYGQIIKTDKEFTDISVSLSVQDLIVKPPGGSAEKGYGHFHFILDEGSPIVVSSKSHTLSGVSPGEHTLKVELMNNDHTPYSPPISESVSFVVDMEQTEYQPAEHEVIINDFSYEPDTLNVKVGDAVVWKNEGKFPRSATCKGFFDTRMISPGESESVIFEKEFSCDYFASNYPLMKGRITVEEAD